MQVIIHPHSLRMFRVVDRLTVKVIPACEPARSSDLKQHADTRPLYTKFAHHQQQDFLSLVRCVNPSV